MLQLGEFAYEQPVARTRSGHSNSVFERVALIGIDSSQLSHRDLLRYQQARQPAPFLDSMRPEVLLTHTREHSYVSEPYRSYLNQLMTEYATSAVGERLRYRVSGDILSEASDVYSQIVRYISQLEKLAQKASTSSESNNNMLVELIGDSQSGQPHIDCSTHILFSCDSPMPDFRFVHENGSFFFVSTQVVVAIRCNSDEDKPGLHSKAGAYMQALKLQYLRNRLSKLQDFMHVLNSPVGFEDCHEPISELYQDFRACCLMALDLPPR